MESEEEVEAEAEVESEEEKDRPKRKSHKRRRTEKKDSNNNQQQQPWIFEQLGVASWLYQHGNRHQDLAKAGHAPWAARCTDGEVTSELQAKLIHSSTQSFHRSQARWYYPMDFPMVQTVYGRKSSRRKNKNKKAKKEAEESDYVRTERAFLYGSRAPTLMDYARETMLDVAHTDDNNDVYVVHNRPQATPTTKWREISRNREKEELLRAHMKYDCPYQPADFISKRDENAAPTEETQQLFMNERRSKGTKFYAQQHFNLADPSNLAPFPINGLVDALKDDTNKMTQSNSDEQGPELLSDPQTRRDMPSGRTDHHLFGNCIVCVPCSCPACCSPSKLGKGPNWCLLHPTGELMDTVSASLLKTPLGLNDDALLRTPANQLQQKRYVGWSKKSTIVYNELCVGDTVRQIEKCGDGADLFLARTDIHVTVFSVVPQRDDSIPRHAQKDPDRTKKTNSSDSKTLCWGTFKLTELQRIDLRSLSRHSPSYVPVHVTSHPKFSGSVFTSYQHKFAILSQSPGSAECNTIHHFLWAKEDAGGKGSGAPASKPFCTKHVIRNLRSISQIVFSKRNPMVMWASALSFVRPTLAADFAIRSGGVQPRLANGYSLYEIDLRTNEATFRWSPSAEEFVTETVHSISCIAVNWSEPRGKSTLWISSVSAGKMWELDERLAPLRVVNSWSLPSQCDDIGALLPHAGGTFGASTAMIASTTCPKSETGFGSDIPVDKLPFFCLPVGGTGVQMFQPTSATPLFQTDNLEIASSSTYPPGDKQSFVVSSAFSLPPVADSSSACGLASVMLPVSNFFHEGDSALAGIQIDKSSHINCVITMVSNGDVCVHTLLGSKEEKRHGSTITNGLAVDNAKKHAVAPENKLAGGMNLYLGIQSSTKSQQKAAPVARYGGVEQESLRPYQFSDLRRLPIGDSDDSDGATDAISIQPVQTMKDVATSRSSGEERRKAPVLRVSRSLASSEPNVEAFSKVASCSSNNQRDSSIQSTAADDNEGRSDVSKDSLQSAMRSWKKKK